MYRRREEVGMGEAGRRKQRRVEEVIKTGRQTERERKRGKDKRK